MQAALIKIPSCVQLKRPISNFVIFTKRLDKTLLLKIIKVDVKKLMKGYFCQLTLWVQGKVSTN